MTQFSNQRIKHIDELVIYADGGARGNPGPAAFGAVLYKKESGGKLAVVEKLSKFLGVRTNNQAEYEGVIASLSKAKELGVEKVTCFLDSELLVEQLNLRYRVKNKELASLFLKAWNLAQNFKKITFHHIPREKNKVADRLVNEALDKIS